MNLPTYGRAMHLYLLGFSLIPISPTSKRPTVKWKRFQTERCSKDDILEWFGHQDHRIGIVTGELSGIVAIDCDDLEASHTLVDDMLADSYPTTTVWQHTKRGMHFIFRHSGTDTRNGRGFLGANIDVRGDGGYILAYEDALQWTAESLADAPEYEPLSREALQAA